MIGSIFQIMILPARPGRTARSAGNTRTTCYACIPRAFVDDAADLYKCDLSIMTCPFCGHIEDRVIDSRESREGDSIRRRRQCLGCDKRFTTYERIDEVPYMVIKKDGRREKFDRQKVLNGLLKACEKRPISMGKLSDLVNQVEARVTDSPDREITTTEIGEFLMDSLRGVDKIAYVRFASVYRDFQDEQAFLNELRSLTRQQPGGPG
jgi:transcriptional repressor NrdR